MSYLETTPDAHPDYREEKRQRIADFATDERFRELSNAWRTMALEKKYMNNFSWLGRPMIQLPMDALAIQELIWTVKPDLVVETGVAHGGSLVLSASILELLGHGEVLGVDIEIRPHNRAAIERHPLAHRISLIEGSSVAPENSCSSAAGSLSRPSSISALQGRLSAPGIWPERRPGRGSGVTPRKRSAERTSTT